MVNHGFFMNSFFAVSIDVYNKKEHIIHCVGYANEFFNNYQKNITIEERPLGEFIFDFSDEFSENRFNVLRDYLEKYKKFVENNKQRWYYDDELFEKHKDFATSIAFIKSGIFSDKFIEVQKHLALNDMHKHSSLQVLKACYPEKTSAINNVFQSFYIEDRLYVATDFNFIELFRFYLDELYSSGMFPRRCMNCGNLFLSGKKHGDVLCSTECKKKKKSQNTMAYYNNLSENEVLFNGIYRKWKQRIERAEEKQTINEKGISQLKEELRIFTDYNRTLVNKRKKENVPEKDGIPDYDSFDNMHKETLERYDSSLYQLFDSLKRNQ
ncbi:MAG: hypothetical protein IKL70_06125 [Oscillospiraceae bacterium]|nr:hypothetical protein [Oscillospiraceae bacterium]